MTDLQVGDDVEKISGVPFQGRVRAVFTTNAGEPRIVVECPKGILYIYRPDKFRFLAGER